ncbi:MAG: diphosphomevalonate decarboxylase [Nitrososphaerota archaeon]|nr:diphosphomevalonate decarboxylase [Candidatus Calditenuaceae archaeon]MDW8073277.1 diphosphomevalonate decarboxylase [Nitrososphaerota archaeon]
MAGRAVAKAYTMQALVKYHGLRDWELRIPFHDSISVNTDVAFTVARVEFTSRESDVVMAGGVELKGRPRDRVLAVIDRVRALAGVEERCIVMTENHPNIRAKGMGFSASAGAAIAAAAYKAAALDKFYGWDKRLLSRIARLLAGSACRSVVGEYAKWLAGTSDEDSYAIRIGDRSALEIKYVIVPLWLDVSTETAHREAETSPFLSARIESANRRCVELEKAIHDGDFKKFGELVERDSLELHAVTMTGVYGSILMTPESLKVIDTVKKLRSRGIPAYFSMQTGPTVYVNTLPEHVEAVEEEIRSRGFETLVSGIGGEAQPLE